MLAIPSRLGPYEVIAPLGTGGMGEVYRARDTRLNRQVAVKVLPELFANDSGRLARFEREAQAVAALSHPNILAIHDYGTHEGIAYAVMELLEGETLRNRLAKGPLPWREAVELSAAIAEGLAAAHAKGIVHRDIKPENLFLTADGRVKILDFGLARFATLPDPQLATVPHVPAQTEPGTVMGSVGYMSPEQVRGQTADAPSDLFSFGCVLYEMVTGQRAFRRGNAADTMTAVLRDEPHDIEQSGQQIPAELTRLIRHCLAKSLKQRLHSARDLALALRATGSNSGPQPQASQRSVEAVAVLPFENVGGDPKTEYLSDGIADHLIISLSQARRDGLKVRPFSSVSRYKRQKTDVVTIGQELNVQVVVTGTLHQPGDELWISVALVDAREDNQLWGKRYQSKLDGILDLQDQIARDVAASLKLRLTDEEEQLLTKRYTEDPAAYLLYREAMYHWYKFSEDGLNMSMEYCRRAIKEDPNYALAHVGLGKCYVVMATVHKGRETYPEAKTHLAKALALDETLPDAHAGMGLIHLFLDWDWPAAERELKQSNASDSSRAVYGFYLAVMGRPADALPVIRQVQELNPLAAHHRNELAMCYNWLRQYDQAIAEAQKSLELDAYFPLAHVELATALVKKGRSVQAIEALRKALSIGRGHPRVKGALGLAYAAAGNRTEAQKILEELKSPSSSRYATAFSIARIHAALGEKNQAFEWLRQACEDRDSYIIWLKVDPILENLRSDPRFNELLRDMRLPIDGNSALPLPATRAASLPAKWVAVVLVSAALAMTAFYIVWRESAGPDVLKTVAPAKAIDAVAVLPFENVGGDPKSEYLSDGVADQIINSLSQVHRQDLKVRPFSSVSRYRRKAPDIPTFGRELNVQMIVTGRLQQQGEELTIHVALVDVLQDHQLWGHTYRGKRDTILDMLDQIARDVAAKLRLGLTDEDDKRLTKRYTADPEAYRLYREGVYHAYKFSPDGLNIAAEYFDKALKKDPKYALAYSGLAKCYLLQGTLYVGPRKTFPEVRKCIDQALKIDPGLADVHAQLGAVYMFGDWNWAAAESEFKRAIELDPNLPLQSLYGFWLAAHDRLPDALASILRGLEFDPLAAPRMNELAMCHNWMRQYDQAIIEAKKANELDPNFVGAYGELGLAYSQKHKHEEAIAAITAGVDVAKGNPRIRGLLGYAFVAAGKQAAALTVLEELKSSPKRRFGDAFAIARIHAALGEKKEAFEWLQKACDEQDSSVIWLKVDPTMENLRSDPRFAKVLTDMRLPP